MPNGTTATTANRMARIRSAVLSRTAAHDRHAWTANMQATIARYGRNVVTFTNAARLPSIAASSARIQRLSSLASIAAARYATEKKSAVVSIMKVRPQKM